MTEAADPKHPQAPPAPQRRANLLWLLLILLTAWLSWPALTSVHVEGFSANLQSMAILLHAHGAPGLALADQMYPVTTEYLYMSRSGLVDALQALIRLTGHQGDGIFRVLMLISLAVYSWTILILARRWSGERFALLLAALVLTPGLVEISFYYADNLPSAALAMLALALIKRDATSALRWLAAGALFAAAVLIRADAALVAAPLGLFLLRERKHLRLALAHTVCLTVGAISVLLLAQWLTPFRLYDSLHIVPLFSTLHVSVRTHSREAVVAAGFFGFITPILLFFGVLRNARTRNWQWHLAWTVLPACFYLYALPRALEVRMFLLLGAPAVLVHGASGLRVLTEMWDSHLTRSRWIVGAVAAVSLAVLFGPVVMQMRDGPRTPLGRMYSPLIWHEWQQSVATGLRQLDTLVASVQPGETVVAISSHFNADHYLRLRLLQAGYDIVPISDPTIPCRGMNEVFRRGDRTVIHLRSEAPYGIADQWQHLPAEYTQQFEVAEEMKCLHAVAFQRAVSVNWEDPPDFFLPAIHGVESPRPFWQRSYPDTRAIPKLRITHYGEMNIQPITSTQMQALEQSAQAEAARAGQTARGWQPLSSFEELHDMYRWRFGSPAINRLQSLDGTK